MWDGMGSRRGDLIRGPEHRPESICSGPEQIKKQEDVTTLQDDE